MAYDHGFIEVCLGADGATALSVASTGVIAQWAPASIPYIVRAVSYSPLAAAPDYTGVVIDFDHWDLGTDALIVEIASVTSSSADNGKVIYKDGLNIKVKAGEAIRVDVNTAVTAGTAFVNLYLEPSWERPANNSDLVASD